MSSPEQSLSGKVALVTGGAGALGSAVCAALRERGAYVVGVDIAGEGVVQADLATERGNVAAVETAVAEHGRLDVLVLNAGVQHMSPIDEFPSEQWHRLLDVMLNGPFYAIRAAWPQLVAHPGSRIIATASTSSFVAEPFKAAYVTAKHGLLGLVKVAAHEGAPYGLTANAVAPSWMRTPMVEAQLADRVRLLGLAEEQVREEMVADHAVKRFVELDEVASAIAFLASSEASAITGACLPVDLGALA
jgi:3-hydroxybutyrate dehydrogenase